MFSANIRAKKYVIDRMNTYPWISVIYELPNPGLAENAENYLTQSYYQAYDKAFNAPREELENEWLLLRNGE